MFFERENFYEYGNIASLDPSKSELDRAAWIDGLKISILLRTNKSPIQKVLLGGPTLTTVFFSF